MIYRHPDNPVAVPISAIAEIEAAEPGRHYAQLKWDGWRLLCYKEGGVWEFHTKHEGTKRPMPAALTGQLEALGFPDGTGLDAERMGMRSVEHTGGREWLVLFDLHYSGGEWQGNIPYEERLSKLERLVSSRRAGVSAPDIEMVETVGEGFAGLYEKSKGNPLTEGIVLKYRKGLLKGGFSGCRDNGGWLKAKWRQ